MAPAVYSDGNVALWVNNPANLPGRLAKIASAFSGMFTDVFVPRSASPPDMALIRSTVRPDGSKLRAHLWTIPGEQTPAQYAAQVLSDIQRLNPGTVELDIEVADNRLPSFIRSTLAAIRAVRPKYRLRVNIAPYKGAFLPAELFRDDPHLYAAEQTYYGDMSRVSEMEAFLDLTEHGVPVEKASCCYGAAGPPTYPLSVNGNRVNTLGSIFYNGAFVGRKLRRGIVFSDDLMADAGML